MNSTLFADNRRPFINDKMFSLLMFINPAIVTTAISIFGVGANIIIIVTFVKMGFTETINISLVALAMSDLANLLCLLWMSLSFNPSFCAIACDIIDLKELEDFLIGGQRSFFTTLGGCITGVIAGERCLCVLRPLQVKSILTRKKVLIMLPCIFIITLIPYLFVFFTTGLAWVFNPATNGSILTRTHKDHLTEVDNISYGLITAFNTTTYVVVTAFTVLIVWKLASQSQWRAGQTDGSSHASRNTGNDSDEKHGSRKKGLSGRDKRAAMTVTVIATMYITCFFPGTLLYFVMSVVPEFNKGMLYTNLYDFLWYLAYVGESICSSANVIVYLKTSTKFKDAFLGLFCKALGRVTDFERT